jgi:uncharacterized membrane protein YfcA
MQVYLWISLTLFVAGFTQGLSGFGSALLALPLLSIYLDVKSAVPLVALAGLSMSLVLLIRLWRHLDVRRLYPLLLGAIPGIPIGVFLLKRLDSGVIQSIIGVILIAYSAYGFAARSWEKGISQKWAYPFGFLAGCLGGALGTAGPGVVVYTSLTSWSKEQVRITLQGFFLFAGLIIVLFQTLGGVATMCVFRYYAVTLPALVLGTLTGALFCDKISEGWYRRIVLVLLLLLGAFMVYRA